jgi:hypothetical protein
VNGVSARAISSPEESTTTDRSTPSRERSYPFSTRVRATTSAPALSARGVVT